MKVAQKVAIVTGGGGESAVHWPSDWLPRVLAS